MEKPYKVVILEDEPNLNDEMVSLMSDFSEYEVTATFLKPIPFIEYAKNNPIDLLLLDMQLGAAEGFEVIKHVEQSMYIIVTTGFGKYAQESYEVKNHIVLDYIMKPIELERLQEAIRKFETAVNINELIKKIEEKSKTIFLKTKENAIIEIETDSITDITRNAHNDCEVCYSNDKQNTIRASLKKLQSDLPEHFVRVSKNQIINLNKIAVDKMDRTYILKGKTEVISSVFWERNKDILNKYIK